ncbi:ABC transporter substrate-binding protein [Paenibacillus lentus]|uniref:ABC transporter substrate-binding protein n=1 Tax=Paenibacillus lentus TaxID=1338368 RepID=UPI003651F0E1
MNRSIVMMCCIVIIAGLLVGCSKEHSKPPEPIVMKIMVDNKTFFSYESIIRSKFPHITLEVIDAMPAQIIQPEDENIFEGVEQRLRDLIQTEEPDMFFRFRPEGIAENVELVDLEPLIKRDNYELNEIQQYLAESTKQSNDSIIGMSPTFERGVLFVNRKLFRQLGISEPEAELSWSEFRQLAERFSSLEANDKPVYGYYLGSNHWRIMLEIAGNIHSMQLFNGEGQLVLDQPAWRDLAEGLIADYKNGTLLMDEQVFEIDDMKQTAMFIGGSSELATLLLSNESADDWTMMSVPIDPRNPQGSSIEPNGLFSINRSSGHVEEAWEVIKYLNSVEAAPHIAASLYYPHLMTHLSYTPSGAFNVEAFTANIGTPNNEYKAPPIGTAKQNQLALTIIEELTAAAEDQKTFEEAWEELLRKSKALLNASSD